MKTTKAFRTASVLLFIAVYLVEAHVKTLQVLTKKCNDRTSEGCRQEEETGVQNPQVLPSGSYQPVHHQHKPQIVPPGPPRPEVIDLNEPEVIVPPGPPRPEVIDQHKPQIVPPGPYQPENKPQDKQHILQQRPYHDKQQTSQETQDERKLS
ncbi:putative uncharacterized protein DDB_G0294196 isoform X2 [Limulus polyphemus]|uniref:Uncharacterized protein n=1 Tax=Limulus polyphemus TaxID=6850 RepID=A0ABM1SZI2_LIMPO|nr:putative uncharacterized protein DDB_G0294196 isoform X2 [Limulus polyphemus]